MTAGGLALAGWKAATATESSGPLGLAVVECEAPAVEVDVNKLVERETSLDMQFAASIHAFAVGNRSQESERRVVDCDRPYGAFERWFSPTEAFYLIS